MNNGFLLVIGALLFSGGVQAQTFKVTKINGDKTRLIVEGNTSSLSAKDTLKFTDEFDEECLGEVTKVQGNTASVNVSYCKNAQAIKVGSSMTVAEEAPVVEEPASRKGKKSQVSSMGLPSINEDWYTLWGFGLSRVSYTKEADDAVEALDDFPGVSRTTLNLDLLGFYWPTQDHRAMYGVILNGVNDNLRSDEEDVSLSILQYTLAFSYHHFFGANIGDGGFIRADVGPSWMRLLVDTPAGDFSDSSRMGVGVLFGGGYSFVIGEETRMPLGAYLAYRNIEGEGVSTLNFNLSFLF